MHTPHSEDSDCSFQHGPHLQHFHCLFQLLLVFGALLPRGILHQQVSCRGSFILKNKLHWETGNRENLYRSSVLTTFRFVLKI